MPLFFIFIGTILFLLGAIILPFVTVAQEQAQTEQHAFNVPGYYEFTLQQPSLLGLYDLSVRRPDKQIRWDRAELHQILVLTEKDSGQQISMMDAAQAAPTGAGVLGFFSVPSSGQWLLIIPEEILPADTSPGNITWALRPPPSNSEQQRGYFYLVMAIVGAVCSGWGLLRLVLPRNGSDETSSAA